MASGVLDGITVVALEHAIAGPYATRQLVDLGARVIKVERPGVGDFARRYDSAVNGLSSHFVWVNRGKESVELDLRTDAGQRVIHRILRRADVFLQNMAPGVIERLGLVPEELRKKYPRLIVCNVSGYGREGPYQDAKAYDLLIQAESGVMAVTGTEDAPAKVGLPIADIAAGTHAFSGVLAALYARRDSGEGSTVEVSMFDGVIEWMSFPLYYMLYAQQAPQRRGPHHSTLAPYGPYPLGDSTEIVVAVQNEREWEQFCGGVLRRPELVSDPRFRTSELRNENRTELDREILPGLAALTTPEVEHLMADNRIAFARMNSLEDVLAHPNLTERGRWRTVGSPVGPIQALLPAIGIEGSQPAMGDIPALGQHTESVVAEFASDSGVQDSEPVRDRQPRTVVRRRR